MSLDYIQVRGSRTSVKAPGTEISSGNSVSASTGVELGRGFDVTNNGLVTLACYPTDSASAATSCEVVGTGDTISLNAGVIRVSAGAAVTGLLMQAGQRTGQMCYVMNCANTTLVFAAVATSKVYGGVNNTIGGYSTAQFVWDNVGAGQAGAGWMRLG